MEVKKYIEVDSLNEAYELLKMRKANQIVGGGAWLKISLKKADSLISLDKLNLNYIKNKPDFIEIGAQTSLRKIETDDNIKSLSSGILSKAINHIMGITVRNLATIGGSIMGKFAFSDLYPVLLVMNVKLNFYKRGEISFEEYIDSPRITDDILVSVKITKDNSVGYFIKVAKTALDFAMINLAVSKDKQFKIAIGSKPAIAKLSISAMDYLNSQRKINDEVIEKVCKLAIEENKISSNVRASKEFREVLIRTYLKRGIKQVIK
ncbi:MAG: FAD binding domain-containing protein [Bacillota bacterium]